MYSTASIFLNIIITLLRLDDKTQSKPFTSSKILLSQL